MVELEPHRNSIEAETIEEERRLAYVGLTRAQQTLMLTLCKQRKRFNEFLDCKPSRFLAELPNEVIRWEGLQKADPKERMKHGKAQLSALKAMLTAPD